MKEQGIKKQDIDMRTHIVSFIKNYLAHLFLIIVVLGFGFAVIINRLDFAIRGLVVAIPVFLFSFYYLKYRDTWHQLKTDSYSLSLDHTLLTKIFFIAFFLSIIVLLISDTRPWYYFALVILMYLVIFFHILSPGRKPHFILVENFLVNLNLACGVVFKYPLYYGFTDIMEHMFYIKLTTISHFIIPPDISIYYAFFPLYHIIVTIYAFLLNLNSATALFLGFSIIYSLAVFFIYMLFKNVVKDENILLLSCLLFSLQPSVIFYSTYVITRVVAFIIFILFLFALYRSFMDKNYSIYATIAIILAVFTMLVHQVSFPQMLLLLLFLIICEWVVEIRRHVQPNIFLFSGALLVGYWLFTPAIQFTRDLLVSRAESFHYGEIILNPTIEVGHEYTYLLTNVTTSVVIFFALLGIGYLLWMKAPSYYPVFGLFGLTIAIFFIPNPLQTLWDVMVLFRTDRYFLFITPFIGFFMAWGFYTLLNGLRGSIKGQKIYIIAITGCLLVFSFFSICYLNGDDCSDFPWRSAPKYLRENELKTISFVMDTVPTNSTIMSDYTIERALYMRNSNLTRALNLPYFKVFEDPTVQELEYMRGYVILRERQFMSFGLVIQTISPPYPTFQPTLENIKELSLVLKAKNKIFSNRDVSIFQSK